MTRDEALQRAFAIVDRHIADGRRRFMTDALLAGDDVDSIDVALDWTDHTTADTRASMLVEIARELQNWDN